MIDNRGDPSPKSGLFAAVGAGTVMSGFYLYRQFVRLIFVHYEHGLEPLGKPGVPLDGVGIGSSLQ